MREVLKWNKDHITGRVIEENVFKPSNGLIGKAKIEVFDKEGNLTNETFTENIIPDYLNRGDLYKALFNSLDNGYTIADNSRTGVNIGTLPYAFTTMVLSTDNSTESEDNVFFKGRVVGYCPRTHETPGTDITRGAYNPTESFSEITADGYRHYHLVYDFGTSQGNGTFNSVWWQRSGYYGETASERLSTYNPHTPFTIQPVFNNFMRSTNSRIVRGADKKYYVRNGSSSYTYNEILNLNKYINGVEGIKTNPNNATYIYNSRAIANGKYVTIENSSYSSGTVDTWKGTFNIVVKDSSTHAVVDTIPIDLRTAFVDWANYFTTTGSGKNLRYDTLGFCTDNGDVFIRLYMYDSNQSTGTYLFPQWDSSTNSLSTTAFTNSAYVNCVYNVISKTWTIRPKIDNFGCSGDKAIYFAQYYGNTPGNTSYTGRTSLSSCYFSTTWDKVEKDGRIYLFSQVSSSTIVIIEGGDYANPIAISVASLGPTCYGYNSDEGILCVLEEYGMVSMGYTSTTYSPTRYSTLYKILPYSAHTKLPNAVTKTNADTMKIQYDYYIQIPMVYSSTGDYITLPE